MSTLVPSATDSLATEFEEFEEEEFEEEEPEEAESLLRAAESGLVSEVSSFLRDHPETNVNWANRAGRTMLHVSSYNGHVEVVKLLLAHPDIDVNLKDCVGLTCLWGWPCVCGSSAAEGSSCRYYT